MRKMKDAKYKFTENIEYWKAVKSSDCSFNGTFLYANRKRNTYCKPSCKSKSRFEIDEYTWFDKPEEAVDLGYRECKRCKTSPEIRLKLAEEIIEDYVKKNWKTPTVEYVAKLLGVTPWHFHRTAKFGNERMTIKKYANKVLRHYRKQNSKNNSKKLVAKEESMFTPVQV